VRAVGRCDDDLPTFGDDLGAVNLERRPSGLDNEHLWIGMPVQVGSGARNRVHEDERHGKLAVVSADERVRVLPMRRVLHVDERAHGDLLSVAGAVCAVHSGSVIASQIASGLALM